MIEIRGHTVLEKNTPIGILVSRFNSLITDQLLKGAVETLKQHGIEDRFMTVVRVPGAYDMPLILQEMARSNNYKAIICLGAVIQGATPHHEFIASDVFSKISQISLSENIPIALGILTTQTIEHAIERAGTKLGNKGSEAALAALEMINVLEQLRCHPER